jgi:hypothetical protein
MFMAGILEMSHRDNQSASVQASSGGRSISVRMNAGSTEFDLLIPGPASILVAAKVTSSNLPMFWLP